jgi:hypothetical protein
MEKKMPGMPGRVDGLSGPVEPVQWCLDKARLTAWRNGNKKMYICSLARENPGVLDGEPCRIKDMTVWMEKPSKLRRFLAEYKITLEMIYTWHGELIL